VVPVSFVGLTLPRGSFVVFSFGKKPAPISCPSQGKIVVRKRPGCLTCLIRLALGFSAELRPGTRARMRARPRAAAQTRVMDLVGMVTSFANRESRQEGWGSGQGKRADHLPHSAFPGP